MAENNQNDEECPPEHRYAVDTAGPMLASNWCSNVVILCTSFFCPGRWRRRLGREAQKLYEKPLINLSCSRQVSIRSLIRVYMAWNWHFQPIAEAPDRSEKRHGCRNLYFRLPFSRVQRSFLSHEPPCKRLITTVFCECWREVRKQVAVVWKWINLYIFVLVFVFSKFTAVFDGRLIG